jgi:hypothetical protein
LERSVRGEIGTQHFLHVGYNSILFRHEFGRTVLYVFGLADQLGEQLNECILVKLVVLNRGAH